MSGTLEMAHLQNQKCPEMALEVALKKRARMGSSSTANTERSCHDVPQVHRFVLVALWDVQLWKRNALLRSKVHAVVVDVSRTARRPALRRLDTVTGHW